ncbi:phenylalanine--tRNA ligase subunit alpha [Rubripirellula amarantea]|uniref:Phenylalanine--tRNA ligase alpha subunit n=1 Tax=Rubripirellula amarantea TaxID=2527999 RepID=A0A5C5WKX2_9BACT|nr:phenylalanine--tRNA ligase subunit alpha [Rubripirellula amarantea]MDA8743383.1 phenylalanine--tRNA ligase subunit alpha [Rubripirellula amarantea]TWT51320.1 Phenylalanine--tRNA ligase alpha subunit [Rubripirellula amarantea]
MSLDSFVATLSKLEDEARAAFEQATDIDSLEEARVKYLGAKSGVLKDVAKQMGTIDKSDRPTAGQKLNACKSNVESAFAQSQERLGNDGPDGIDPTFDPTLPGVRPNIGHVHPITQTINHLMEIMGRMGFEAAEGPEVEDPWHNFVALNIPEDHPARDPLDNFYLASAASMAGDKGVKRENVEGTRLLRSQTSTVQIRVMENTQPPIRIISLGRVYRPDQPDATHFPMFHQMEGLLVDTNVTMANLKTVLRVFANNYLGDDVEIRFRPSFFPFTEPSVEVDFFWNGSWIEFGGAGMVDPDVFKAVGYDPDKVSGFAFGLGVERLCMRRHGITDIRDLYSGDLRFLRQF